jgi:hypothetical protein
MSSDDRTVRFSIWPHLITLEGPAEKLAAIIEDLYNDPRLPREQWSLGNTDGIGRRAMVLRLRKEHKALRRVGLAAITRPMSDAIEKRVRAAGIKCFTMHVPEKEL